MSDEIKLTLEPTVTAAAEAAQIEEAVAEVDAAVMAAVQEASKGDEEVAQKVSQDALLKQQFSEDERKMISEFSKQIDVTDSNLVFAYGAAAQKNISQFSDSALKNVKTKDLDEVGNQIANLVAQLKGFDVDEEPKGLAGLFRKKGGDVTVMKAKFDDVETNVDKIVAALEGHQVQMLKDIAMLDRLYEENLKYFKELSMYIVAGKERLEAFRANEVQEAYDKAKASGLPEDAQAAKDLSDKADRFEKKIYDLELTRNISIQMAPQIRMIQSSNQLMAEKIQTSIVNTIPLWKNQMVLALGVAHTQKAMEAQRSVTDVTNQLLEKNAQKLHMASVGAAKEAERGIVDIETLKRTNQQLINTMDEVLNIQQKGKEKRRAAEQELADIETQLREKLLEIRK